MHEAKTYRQYIEQTPFESVWGVLRVQYGETEDVRQSYIDLCEELKTLPPSPKCKPIQITSVYNSQRETESEKFLYLNVFHVCYRQEALIDQIVKIESTIEVKDEEVLALILYMSTLHGFETGKQADKAMGNWLKSLKDDEKNSIPLSTEKDKAESKSIERKRHYFWKYTIGNDYAYDWSFILQILERKIEYNIGYWYYHQRYVGWDKDVARMELCCQLIDIVVDESYRKIPIVNYKNAYRFNKEFELSDDKDIMNLHKLRKKKAFHLIFKLLDKEMCRWWD